MQKTLPMLALAVLLAAGSTTAAVAVEVENTYTEELPLSSDGALVVGNRNGSITVQSWDSARVQLTCRKVVTAESEQKGREWLDKINVEILQDSPDRIEVRTVRPEDEGWGMFSFLFGERPTSRVDYRLTVPRGARLWLSSVNGSLEVLDPAGQVIAETVNGSVRIAGAAAPVQAETVNGQVDLELATGIDEPLPGIWLARLGSVNGPVTIRLPAGISAHVTASTLNGGIRSDHSLPVVRDLVGATAEGDIGGGGAEITLETLNGSIRILAAN